MSNFSKTQKYIKPTDGQVNITALQKVRGRYSTNIWIFDSPKNNKRLSILGEVAFMHCVLMEGDVSIQAYDLNPVPVYTKINDETHETTLDAHVYFSDDHMEWWEFKNSIDTGPGRVGRSREQLSAQAQCASERGIIYQIKTELDLRKKECLFDNWLTLCSLMTRCKLHSYHYEMSVLENITQAQNAIRVGDLVSLKNVDIAHMYAAIALALQKNFVSTNLVGELFSTNSLLRRCQ